MSYIPPGCCYIKPGCCKELSISLPGVTLTDITSMKVIFKSEICRDTACTLLELNYPGDSFTLEEDHIVLNLSSTDTNDFPMDSAVWMDILPVLSNGFRPPVALVRLLTSGTLAPEGGASE